MKLEVNFGNANMSVITVLSLRCLYTVTEVPQVTLLLGISSSYPPPSISPFPRGLATACERQKIFLSDEGPTLETLDRGCPTFLNGEPNE